MLETSALNVLTGHTGREEGRGGAEGGGGRGGEGGAEGQERGEEGEGRGGGRGGEMFWKLSNEQYQNWIHVQWTLIIQHLDYSAWKIITFWVCINYKPRSISAAIENALG